MDNVIFCLNAIVWSVDNGLFFVFQLELDLVAALTAENITVLLPSHIQQEDNPADIPNLFVRLRSTICPCIKVVCMYLCYS